VVKNFQDSQQDRTNTKTKKYQAKKTFRKARDFADRITVTLLRSQNQCDSVCSREQPAKNENNPWMGSYKFNEETAQSKQKYDPTANDDKSYNR